MGLGTRTYSYNQGNEIADKEDTTFEMQLDIKMKSKIKKRKLSNMATWYQTTSQMLNIKVTTKRWEAIKVFNRSAQAL
jgi:hypothetical protein